MKQIQNSFLISIIAMTLPLLGGGNSRERTVNAELVASFCAVQNPSQVWRGEAHFGTPQTPSVQATLTMNDWAPISRGKVHVLDSAESHATLQQHANVQYRAKLGIAESIELIKDYFDVCYMYGQSGAELLERVKRTHDHSGLEKIMGSTSRILNSLENDTKFFDEQRVSPEGCELAYKDMLESEQKAYKCLNEVLEIAKSKWDAKVDSEVGHWARDYDKALAREKDFSEEIGDCLKKVALEQDRFKQAIYEGQLDYVQKQKLQEYRHTVNHLSRDKLQREYAASCDRLARHLKDAEKYKAAIPRAHPGCNFPKVHLAKEEFYADLERKKQGIVSGLLASKTPKETLSDEATKYVQKSGMSQEMARRLGSDCVEDLASVSRELVDYPVLLDLGADLESARVNPLDMVATGQAGMGEQGVYDTSLRNGALDAGRTLVQGVGKGIDQFSTMNKDAMFFVMDFLDHPGQVTHNVAENIAQGANHFASQFKGDYSRLNELLAHEPEQVRTFFQNQVAFYQGAYGTVLSPKTIETIVGTHYCASKLPSAAWERFKGLSAEDKVAFVVKQGLGVLTPGAVVAQAGEAIQAAKLAVDVAGTIAKQGATAVAEGVAAAAGKAGEAVAGAVQGAQKGERVAVAGAGELAMTPGVRDAAQKIAAVGKIKPELATSGEAGAQSGLPNSMFRQGEASGAQAVEKAVLQKNPLQNIKFTDKVKDQMLQQDCHGFPQGVEAFGSEGIVSKIKGGDGILRTKIEIKGSYLGKDGIFEYIIEPDGITCNHRFFKPNF